MRGFGTADVARLLRMGPHRVRALARSGFLHPARDRHGAYRFTFQDVVLLRAAKALADARVPAPRIHRALRSLKRQLPADRPLSQLRITAEGDRVVVRDGSAAWHPESGQLTLDFAVSELITLVAPLMRRRAWAGQGRQGPRSESDWFDLGLELEETAQAEAIEAYRRCLALDPEHAEAMVNLGRLLQNEHRLGEAELLYRRARTSQPEMAVAAFNLGTVLDELRRPREAAEAYQETLQLDPSFADAHYNLSTLYEQAGNRVAAFRHLRQYRQLTGRRRG